MDNNNPALTALVANIAANFKLPVSPTDAAQFIIAADHPVSVAYGFAGPIVVDFYERTGREAGKMEVKAFPHGIDHHIARGSMGDNCILPSMSVSMTRPLPAILKEICRRVLNPAVAPINARFERAAQKAAHEQEGADAATKIADALPMVQVSKPKHSDKTVVSFNNNGIYVNARIEGNNVYFDNMGGLTPERFIIMMQALVETIPADPAEADKIRDMMETDEIRGYTDRVGAMKGLHAHLLRGIEPVVDREAAERARENLHEAELSGESESYLRVLRLRVRQAERAVAEVYGEEAAGRDLTDDNSKATGGKYS